MIRRTIATVVAALFLSLAFGAMGCHSCPTTDGIDEATMTDVGIRLISNKGTRVIIEFTPSPDFTHVVQEITLDSGDVLVECFRCDGKPIYDFHSWGIRPHWRTMRVYAANVTGTDERNGFAHLPDNGAGLKTSIGPGFNADYQATHETRGKITARSPASFVWTITDEDGMVTVKMPTVGEGK